MQDEVNQEESEQDEELDRMQEEYEKKQCDQLIVLYEYSHN